MKNFFKSYHFMFLGISIIIGCSQENPLPDNDGLAIEDVPAASSYSEECRLNKTLTVGASYKLNNNIWGAGTNGAGNQCVWYNSSNGQWGVNSSHTSGSAQNIKGYPSLVRGWIWFNSNGSIWASPSDNSYPTRVRDIKSFHSNWSVVVPNNGEKYNTAYDIWLDGNNNPNYKAQYEIMVWINYKGPAYNGNDFKPVGTKIASNISRAGHRWDVYEGWNGSNNVFTFRRTSNTNSVNNINLLSLINYAKDQGFIKSSDYVLGLQAGFEIVSGGAFKTTNYTSTLVKK